MRRLFGRSAKQHFLTHVAGGAISKHSLSFSIVPGVQESIVAEFSRRIWS